MTERVYTQTFCAVGGIIEREGKILLVKEAATSDKGKWNMPAGWLDVGENPLHAVVREVKEETGLDFEPEHLVGVYSLVRKDHEKSPGVMPHAVSLFFCGHISGTLMQPNDEIAELRWFSPEEIQSMDQSALRSLNIKQRVRDYFDGKRHPLDIIYHAVQN